MKFDKVLQLVVSGDLGMDELGEGRDGVLQCGIRGLAGSAEEKMNSDGESPERSFGRLCDQNAVEGSRGIT